MKELSDMLIQEGQEAGIDLIGITDAKDIECLPWSYPERPEHYFPCKASQTGINTYSPKKIMDTARSVVVTAMYMYGYDKLKKSEPGAPRGNIGPWTRGYVEARDYAADWVTDFLRKQGYVAMATNELPYRTLAVKAGLGKIGKNGFFYHEGMGSYLNLCCILTDAPLKHVDHGTVSAENDCGKCKLCSKMCPTGAMDTDGIYHADLCLHLWQQGQGKYGDKIPPEERHKCMNYLMRTGRCMEVCPKNRNLVPRKSFPFQSEEKEDSPLLIPLIMADDDRYREVLPYHVYKYGIEAVRRDVLIATGNSRDKNAVGELAKGIRYLDEICRGLCAWALGEIGSEEAEKILSEALALEKSSAVRKEIERAIEQIKKRGI